MVNCFVCGVEITREGRGKAKYCKDCRIPMQRAQAQKMHQEDRDAWNNLPQEEQLRRIELCTKKLLEQDE